MQEEFFVLIQAPLAGQICQKIHVKESLRFFSQRVAEPDQIELLEMGVSSTGSSLLLIWSPAPCLLKSQPGSSLHFPKGQGEDLLDGSSSCGFRNHSSSLLLRAVLLPLLHPSLQPDSIFSSFKGLLPIIHDG